MFRPKHFDCRKTPYNTYEASNSNGCLGNETYVEIIKQIMEAAQYQTATFRPFTSNLKNHPGK